MSVNQGFSNIKSIKIVSIHEFYFVLDSKNWQLYNGYGDFLLVGSLDFGNRYVVIKSIWVKKLFYYPGTGYGL